MCVCARTYTFPMPQLKCCVRAAWAFRICAISSAAQWTGVSKCRGSDYTRELLWQSLYGYGWLRSQCEQGPCWAGPALHCPQGKLTIALPWDTEARELASPLTGELATVLKRNGPTPYGRRGRTDPDGMHIGELTLWPQCPWNNHFSSHSGAQSSLGWAALTSTPSTTFWSSGRNWSSGTIPAGSSRLGAAMGYSRGVRVKVQWWWCVPESEALSQTNDALQWTFASTADRMKGCSVWHTEAPRITRMNEEVWGRDRTKGCTVWHTETLGSPGWMKRCEGGTKHGEAVFFFFCFVFVCLPYCFVFFCGALQGWWEGYEEVGRWVQLGFLINPNQQRS